MAHQKTNKTPEELAHQREVRLKARLFKAFLKTGGAERAVEYLDQLLNDPAADPRTKTQASGYLLANASKLLSKSEVNIDNRSVQLSAADLLKLEAKVEKPEPVKELPTGRDPAIHGEEPEVQDAVVVELNAEEPKEEQTMASFLTKIQETDAEDPSNNTRKEDASGEATNS